MQNDRASFITGVVGEPDASPRQVPERVVQDVWRRQRLQAAGLSTTGGSRIIVEDPGRLNTDQGPDFVDARIVIDGVRWHGAVEIHRCSAEWYHHGHETDPLYNNVILHATLVADRETGNLRRQDGSVIPEIVLLPRLDASLRHLSWDHEITSNRAFPCEAFWGDVPADVVDPFLIDLAALRMRSKAARIAARFEENHDLNQIAYEETFRALGYMPNAEPMVLLARRVPVAVSRQLDSEHDFLCLLLGISGLLPDVSEFVHGDRSAVAYAMRIGDRFEQLNQDFGLTPLPRPTWRFSRMRPNNFPPLRIAQAAALFGGREGLSVRPVAGIIRALSSRNPRRDLESLLDVEPDRYWKEHSSLTKRRARPASAAIGGNRRTTIIVNAFLPVALFHLDRSEPRRSSAAIMRCLEALPAQPNAVTRPYCNSRGTPRSATVTQGLHELEKNWCAKGRCVECPVGRHLSRKGCRFTA